MKKETVIALIDLFVSDAIEKIQLQEGPQGLRGFKGIDGRDFDFEEHRETITEIIVNNLPKEINISEETLASLKGKDGRDGKDGVDGRDGKDFSFEENSEIINSIIKQYVLTFDKLTDDQKEELRGPKGRDGKDGKNLIFSDNKEEILKEISEEIKLQIPKIEELRLRFEDLSEEQKEELRGQQGPRGQKGKSGKDFIYEEHEENIKTLLDNKVDSIRDVLKLRFSDLTEEEIQKLTFTFDKFTDEQLESLRGPRGQKGKSGRDGEQGVQGKMGPRGIPGLSGLNGRDGVDGEDGEDGKDAPTVEKIKIEEGKDDFRLAFSFSDGTELKTNKVNLPKGKVSNNYYYATSGNRGSGGTSSGDSNLDGGNAETNYGGMFVIDGGGSV